MANPLFDIPPKLKKALEERDRQPYKKTRLAQGSAEWLMARIGRITSSTVYRILSDREGTYARFLEEKIKEKQELAIPGYYYQSQEMYHGHICEPQARELAGMVAEKEFLPTPMMLYKPLPILADSNDGLTADGKIVLEAKCPSKASSFEKIKNQGVPNYHYMQAQVHMMVTGAEKCLYMALYVGEGIEFYDGELYHHEWIWPDAGMQLAIRRRAARVNAYLKEEGLLITEEDRQSDLYRRNTAALQEEIDKINRINERRAG